MARKFYCFGKEGKNWSVKLQLDRYFPNPKTIIMVRLKGELKNHLVGAGIRISRLWRNPGDPHGIGSGNPTPEPI